MNIEEKIVRTNPMMYLIKNQLLNVLELAAYKHGVDPNSFFDKTHELLVSVANVIYDQNVDDLTSLKDKKIDYFQAQFDQYLVQKQLQIAHWARVCEITKGQYS